MTEQRNEAYELVVAQQQTEIESLRAQLAEALTAKDAYRHEAESFCDQLLATQAHAARLVEALVRRQWDDDLDETACPTGGVHCPECEGHPKRGHDAGCYIGKAISTPINLDALHEALACECERLAGKAGWAILKPSLLREAAAHRAKKEGK